MTDYSPNGSVAPLIPGDINVETVEVNNKTKVGSFFVIPNVPTTSDLPTNLPVGSIAYVVENDGQPYIYTSIGWLTIDVAVG